MGVQWTLQGQLKPSRDTQNGVQNGPYKFAPLHPQISVVEIVPGGSKDGKIL